MEAEDTKMFLENIEEFVMDEEKIVTYKWLSSTLNLHVNTAKQLLYMYAMPNGKIKAHVHLTYLVGGTLLDGCGVKFQIVREQDLEKVKLQFKVVTSEHIYSVQKASTLPDLNILFAIDNLKNNENSEDKLGPIRCKNAIRRLENEITSIKSKARVVVAVENKPVLNGKKNLSNPVKSDLDKSKTASELVAVNSSSTANTNSSVLGTIKVKQSEPKSGTGSDNPTIASMFSAQSKTNSIGTKAGSTPKPKNPKGGIAMFFTKQAEKPIKPKNSETSVEAPLKEAKSVSETICAKSSKPCATVLDEEKHVASNKANAPEKTKNGTEAENKNVVKSSKKGANAVKKTEVIEKQKCSGKGKKKKSVDELPAKRRKRILVISDDSSSDSDIFGKDESDTEMPPPSPERLPEEISKSPSSDEDVIPSTPASQQVRNGKMRKRKLVDKTFEDKDGFIMTKKEYVFESCSEDEGENNKPAKENHTNEEVKPNCQDAETNCIIKNTDAGVEKDKPSKNNSNGEKQIKKKKTSPVASKNKQSSIMSFFNKN